MCAVHDAVLTCHSPLWIIASTFSDRNKCKKHIPEPPPLFLFLLYRHTEHSLNSETYSLFSGHHSPRWCGKKEAGKEAMQLNFFLKSDKMQDIRTHAIFFFNKNKYIQYIHSCSYVRLNSYQDRIYSYNSELTL